MDRSTLDTLRRLLVAAVLVSAGTFGVLVSMAFDAGADLFAWIVVVLAFVALALVGQARRLVDRVEVPSSTTVDAPNV
ncbi:hypothetical protein ACFPK1_22415 [Actinomycetospora rhizophila]|uniref:Uncharacterized protein n=1 Tax=Actinomycetospora rhizophila TaxID=1416876 RepID=A0ABV9ZIG0_9PSEU